MLAWFALVLQLYLVIVQSPPGLAMLGEVITYFSFFTILTNLLVALVFTAVALCPVAGWVQFFSSPSVQGGTAVYIAIVGIVYQLLLRQLWNPKGAQLLADMLLHAVIPLGYVVYWLIFAPRAGLSWRDAVVWLVYPGVYLVYVLARGAVSRALSLPFSRCQCAGIRRSSAPCRSIDGRLSGYGFTARSGEPLDANSKRMDSAFPAGLMIKPES